MAYVGLVKPTIAKLDESGGTPKYTDGFACGKAMEMSINPQYAEGSLYADDQLSEYDKEFKYADITLRTSTLPIQAHNNMFGHTVDDGTDDTATISDRVTDDSNYVGFGIYVKEKVNNKYRFIAMWIYKTKFAEGQEDYKTKGDNIEYQTPSISGRAAGLEDGRWRERKIFRTIKEAQDWLDEMAGIKESSVPGGGDA
ncbi:MAG: major tail protein [Lachnospiraceae bacterium]